MPLDKVTIILTVWFENKVHKAITCSASYVHQPVSAPISSIPESYLIDAFMRLFPAMSWNPQDAAQWASISPWDAHLSVTGTRMGKWWPHPGQPCNDRHQEQAVLATGTLGYPIPILLISPDKPCLLFNNVSAIGKWPQVCQFHPLCLHNAELLSIYLWAFKCRSNRFSLYPTSPLSDLL